jgi:putative sigma-54 modulation protein
MNTEIKAVHFTLGDDGKEYLEKKIARLHKPENIIVDLLFTLTRDNGFSAEVTVNFRWGNSVHVKEHEHELLPAIDKMMDVLSQKIDKEKEKMKEKGKEKAQFPDESE